MPSRNRTRLAVALALGASAPALAQHRGAPKIHEVSSPPAIASASDLPAGDGPRGTSGEVQDDSVGYAGFLTIAPEPRWSAVTMAVAHPSVPPGTPVEITALDTGRIVVALVIARDTEGGVVSVAPGVAQALGIGDRAPVRVRAVVASPQDQVALRSGRVASARLDAPPALLVALRRKLPARPTVSVAPVVKPPKATTPIKPRLAAPPPRVATRTGGFLVQVAALSSADRAAELAKELGGRVVPLGRLFRVQLGPFADKASAQRARDGAARRGYHDAQIFQTN
ncbi:SPOR domain-containing protein [Sphingomonas sp.]|jgi:rare lipoprotein A|uniref:SPOR domain-containing protein n=1 Tax=Sphingomonas sp. TaxID=28214 RepID=UPI0035686E80